MKKNYLFLCLGMLFFFVAGATTADAAAKQNRFVGLHDRILPITDVRVIDSDTKVPVEDIAKFLYLPVEEENGKTVIRKRGIEFIFDPKTGVTTQDGKELPYQPIVVADGKTMISVKYIAREIGFKIEYFQKYHTLRIYRDDYESMSHEAFEKKIPALTGQQSGGTAIKSPAQNKPKPKDPKAYVYLTFDDGPNYFTTVNNATLKKYGIKGSFFFLGPQIQAHPDIAKATAGNGHYIGSHSMTHDEKKLYLSTKTFMDEMNEGTRLIKQTTGKDAPLIRVPYGSVPHVTPAMQEALVNSGYKMWDWSVDSNDWKYTDKEYEQIIANVKNGVTKSYKNGERYIVVLMHDRSQSAKALPVIIEWLQKEGYEMRPYDPNQHFSKNFLHDKRL